MMTFGFWCDVFGFHQSWWRSMIKSTELSAHWSIPIFGTVNKILKKYKTKIMTQEISKLQRPENINRQIFFYLVVNSAIKSCRKKITQRMNEWRVSVVLIMIGVRSWFLLIVSFDVMFIHVIDLFLTTQHDAITFEETVKIQKRKK